MGAWGDGAFDNDTACDWTHSVKEKGLHNLVWNSLLELQSGHAHKIYVWEWHYQEAVAAADIVAAIAEGDFDKAAERFDEVEDEDIIEQAKLMDIKSFVAQAHKALDKMAAGIYFGKETDCGAVWSIKMRLLNLNMDDIGFQTDEGFRIGGIRKEQTDG